MSNYIKFRDILKDRVSSMMQNNEHLYVVDVSKQEIWNTYLNSFKEGEERQHYNCNCCYKYLKNIGKLVEIVEIDGKLIRKSIWDNLDGVPTEYHDTINALHSLIESKPIYSVFYSKEIEYGKDHNFKELEDGSSIRWDHFHCRVKNDFVKGSDTPTYRNNINSRTRSLVKSLDVHKEIWQVLKKLIQLNKIAKSESWEWAVDQMIVISAKFQEDPNELYAWKYASDGSLYLVGSSSFGVLVKDLNEDSDLITQIKDKSVEEIKSITEEYFETEKGKEGLRSYNHITDPRYYQQMQKAASLRQIKEAEEFLSKEGYMNALDRVHATVNDITVPNTLFIDRSSETAKKLNVFEKMKADTKTKLNKEPETITSNEFLKLLPEVQKMEVLFSKEMINHLMVMTAPADRTAPSLLKWDNNYGFNYKGGYAGSVRERVKQAGGKIIGDLVCSLGWYNHDDLDLHCRFENENRKEHIYFSSKYGSNSKAQLDVDANAGSNTTKTPVENIYVETNDLREGTYSFYVNQFSKRENKDGGFEIYLTILGENYTYFHNNTANNFDNVKVCDVTVGNNNEITINHHIQPSVENSTNSFEMWGMKTETWQPVTVVSPSPNFWDNNQVGEKHYFFFLANSVMPDTERPQGFFNEFLSQELSKYKRVLQDAGRRIEVPYSTDQLSGLGFQKARNQSVIVKVSGNKLNKVFNVQF